MNLRDVRDSLVFSCFQVWLAPVGNEEGWELLFVVGGRGGWAVEGFVAVRWENRARMVGLARLQAQAGNRPKVPRCQGLSTVTWPPCNLRLMSLRLSPRLQNRSLGVHFKLRHRPSCIRAYPTQFLKFSIGLLYTAGHDANVQGRGCALRNLMV